MKEEILKSEEEYKVEVENVFERLVEIPEAKEALEILDNLPKDLYYHNKDHTLDVIKETILFALADGASPEVIKQQVISAAWHDVGFIIKKSGNEPEAVNLFKKSRAWDSLASEEREEVVSNILDTGLVMEGEIPHFSHFRSKNKYILDADVGNFGRDDYFKKRLDVARELGLDLEDVEIRKRFFTFALNMMKNHNWETYSARIFRQAKKKKNIKKAEEELAKLT